VVTAEVTEPFLQRAVDEGMAPAAVADLVADAITANRFWVFTDPRLTRIALDRWQRIAEGLNPQTEVDSPGMPPAKQLTAEIRRLLAGLAGALWLTVRWLTGGGAARSLRACTAGMRSHPPTWRAT
jgi:hypothetical protein